MSSYIDINFSIYSQPDFRSLKENQNIYLILGVLIVVILKNHNQKQEVLSIEKRMICFSNAITVVWVNLGNLIKFLDLTMHKEYIFERFKDGKPTKEKPEFDFTPSKELKTRTADKVIR